MTVLIDRVPVAPPLNMQAIQPASLAPTSALTTSPPIGENRQNGHLYAVWQDYRTGEYHIHPSRSTDGGLTWQESNARVTPDSGRDHYFPAVDVANGDEGDEGDEGSRGDLVAVSYFRTDRGPNENVAHLFVVGDPGVGKGNTDYSLAGGRGTATPYAARQVSPETPSALVRRTQQRAPAVRRPAAGRGYLHGHRRNPQRVVPDPRALRSAIRPSGGDRFLR
jgi:hypothetical protein